MLRAIKNLWLQTASATGISSIVGNSQWRRNRLLILCYHGISQEDEHQWRPSLYMPAERFRRRLELLKAGGYTVLPLRQAIKLLYANDLPPRSVAITFDDGCYDFYRQAYPELSRFGFPVTVYQSTYYCDYQKPVFNLVCSYMLWKRRADTLEPQPEWGIAEATKLGSEDARQSVVSRLMRFSARERLTGAQKNELAEQLARILGVDFDALLKQRLLHLMTQSEIAELSEAGVDFELHTHRHRMPEDHESFQAEIGQNRQRLREITGKVAEHFCYPLGTYDERSVKWLREEGIVSATTCDPGLASLRSNPMLLPRFVDRSTVSPGEFCAWLSGVAAAVARSRPNDFAPAIDAG